MIRRFGFFLTIPSVCALLCCAIRAEGPLFSIWHVDGHGYQWQLEQIDAELPLEPSVRMVFSDERNHPKSLAQLNAAASLLARLDGGPIVLRMNNIGPELDRTIARIEPLNEDTWRHSHMCVNRRDDGTLNDTPMVCPLAGTEAWSLAGREWATSKWMRRLQQIIPNPTGVILRENNEGARMEFKRLFVRQGVKALNSKGKLVWADASTQPNDYADPPPTTKGIVYRVEGNQVVAYWWKSDVELDALDLRVKEWVGPRRGSFPPDSLGEWSALENAQYHALYTAFDANSASGWQGKLRTCGYGSYDENRQNDAASPAMYLGYYRDADLTVPGAYAITRFDPGSKELEAESANPRAWREYSISFMAPAAYMGAQKRSHAVVDPESFASFMSHVAWRLQSPGKEVRLTYWDNSSTRPDHLIFAAKSNAAELKPDWVDALKSIGREDMLTLTIEDYELATLRALDRVHDNATINRYWREGTTRSLSSPLNTDSSTKVYATETTIPGVAETLLCVYTPCDLEGEIPVGEYAVPAKRIGYWLTPELSEIP